MITPTQVMALVTSPELLNRASTLSADLSSRPKRSTMRSARSPSPGPNAAPTTRNGISEVKACAASTVACWAPSI